MNDNHEPITAAEEREALLTAFALDQLPETERAEVKASIADDPAAQAFVAETRRLSLLAKDALSEEAAPATSAALRRELDERLMVQEVLAKPMPLVVKRGWRREIVIGTVAGGLLASLLIPGLWDRGAELAQRVVGQRSPEATKSARWEHTGDVQYAAPETKYGVADDFDLTTRAEGEPALDPRATRRSKERYGSQRGVPAQQLQDAPTESAPVVAAQPPHDYAPAYQSEFAETSAAAGQGEDRSGSGKRFMFGVGVNSDAGVTGAVKATPAPHDPAPFAKKPVSGPTATILDDSRSMSIVSGEADRLSGFKVELEKLQNEEKVLREVNQRAPGAVSGEELRQLAARREQIIAQIRGDTVHGAEQYDQIIENTFLPSKDNPLSTFSIDVDTASYANTRRFLTGGTLPPPSAVRIEELINYFTYDDPQPEGNGPFSVNMELAECPWSPGHHVLRVGLKGREIAKDKRPNSNLVFLLDVSGSMQSHNKLPLVKQAMQMLTRQLTENDMVTIVVYAGQEGLALDTTSGDQQEKILGAIENLSAGGSTHASAGITLAYQMAQKNFLKDGTNRVILCTDGDFNVGVTSDEALVDLITEKAKSNIFLSVLGFGMGNLKDAKMEKLADKGNGNYGYIDNAKEAQKMLVEQMTGSLITIAKDVKIQIEFNPAQIASYRQIGYENRVLAAKDFDDDTKDAGEIGAGHSVTALYEVVLVGNEAKAAAAKQGDVSLKYQRPVEQPKPETPADRELTEAAGTGELCTVKLRFKEPTGDKSELMEFPLKQEPKRFGQASENLRFASAVAAFGMVLRDSDYRGGATMSAVEEIASASLGKDPNGYRAEFLELIRKAKELGK